MLSKINVYIYNIIYNKPIMLMCPFYKPVASGRRSLTVQSHMHLDRHVGRHLATSMTQVEVSEI